MKIALIGYGGMGQAVYKIATEREHEVSVIVDPNSKKATHEKLMSECLKNCDVAIDFSLAAAVFENAKICKEAGVNLVIGTTGWLDKMDSVRELFENSEVGCLWSSNFSIGVNLYFKIVEEAAKLMDKFDEYDIWGHEIHHYNKADSPSGTAKTLGNILLENIKRKTAIIDEKLDRKRTDNEIHFSSLRGGPVNFAHTIGFDSAADTITISHNARNRDGYALGAVKAAEWVFRKHGFFSMNDFLDIH